MTSNLIKAHALHFIHAIKTKEYDIIDVTAQKWVSKKFPLYYPYQESGNVLLELFQARQNNFF